MERYQLTSTFIGLIIAVCILWLVRRDHLHGRFAIWWIGVGAICALLGVFPRIIDLIAARLGIAYPPTLALLVGMGLLVLKIISMDIERSRNETRLQRLAQQLAILEGELGAGKDKSAKDE